MVTNVSAMVTYVVAMDIDDDTMATSRVVASELFQPVSFVFGWGYRMCESI